MITETAFSFEMSAYSSLIQYAKKNSFKIYTENIGLCDYKEISVVNFRTFFKIST